MSSASSGPTLTCSQCNFVNEAERVYCHNCGAKLDRSLLPAPTETPGESMEKARKRVKKMTNPGGFNAAQEIKSFANTIVYAVLVAGIIGIVREPENVPPVKADDVISRMVSSELAEALESPQARVLQFTEAEINTPLRSSLKSKATGLLPGVEFQRAYVRLDPGNIDIGLVQSIAGYPLYSTIRYEIGVKDGKFFATNHGGSFGRIAVHPAIMQYLGIAFGKLWTAFKREQGQMDMMQQVLVAKGRIALVTKAHTP